MQTFIGRLTADAQIKQTQDGREVVNFSIALNRKFKPKGSNTAKVVTTFVNCSYWLSTGIAAYLKKGRTVATTGHIGLKTWTSPNGEARAAITQWVRDIDPWISNSSSTPNANHTSKSNDKWGKPNNESVQDTTEVVDDLPF
ncbi:MAG: single-stranded DNA-binding protein [Chitinophagaceae bacterium]|nr:MAG: single-stranded DNA-binding protein [Chitinophagaceae bacterium]